MIYIYTHVYIYNIYIIIYITLYYIILYYIVFYSILLYYIILYIMYIYIYIIYTHIYIYIYYDISDVLSIGVSICVVMSFGTCGCQSRWKIPWHWTAARPSLGSSNSTRLRRGVDPPKMVFLWDFQRQTCPNNSGILSTKHIPNKSGRVEGWCIMYVYVV